jgi:predicted dehydrogenase
MAVSRRGFLKGAAVGAAASVMPWGPRAFAGTPGDGVRVAVIGLRGRGKSHISAFGERIVMLCDIDEQVLASRASDLGKVDTTTDYRRVLERKDIDVVSIATPNHTHALIAIEAAQAGKDVYLEKPVSHNVWEGRQIVNAARKYGRIIQCGTQSRSSPSLAEAVRYVQDGKLGAIQHAVGTCYKARKSIGKLYKPLEIPAHIHYDLWCGPAPMVDLYRPNLHYDWHWDFNTGNGDMGNQGIHQMDIARWFLGESTVSPRVVSIGGRLGYDDAGNTPNTQIVYHDYARAPLIFETRGLPRSREAQAQWNDSMDNYRGSQIGVIVQCERGHVLVPSYTRAEAYDREGQLLEEWTGGGNHFQNFLAAVESRRPEDLNAEVLEGHLSSALCHTGNLSHQLGRREAAGQIAAEIASWPLLSESFDRMAAHLKANAVDVNRPEITMGPWLEMDVSTERFTNSDAANQLLTREYREPYVVPDLSA